MVERLRRATLGEYEVGPELGRGGMATVFLAHEIALDRKVAIKVMVPGLLMGEGVVERFRREAVTMAHLHHPNIVSVFSVRQAEGLHFFVMRYVQGRSLEQVLQQAGRLPLPVVRSIVYQVGSALTYAHRSRVIHRDIKPANILIDREGNAVVTDFGIAKAAEAPTKTITGALVGTPAYMSPEQCAGAEVSWAADQYALGAVAYEMLTSAPPFAGSSLTVMQSHVERPPVPLRELRADCPPELEAAILRMLAKDPAHRWLRMPDAMTALGAIPLAEDDPLRIELGRLAVPSEDDAPSNQSAGLSPTPSQPSSTPDRVPGRVVGGISILPPSAGLEVGDSFVLVATVRGRHGTRLPPSAVKWSSDAPDVLRFDRDGGVAVAVGPGVTLLTATCNGARAVLRVEVFPPKADEIVICPLDQTVHAGDEIRLEAIVRDKRGQPISHALIWESADPSIATVAADGALVAIAPGLARITVAADDARSSLVLPVLPARVAAIRISGQPATAVRDRTFLLSAMPVDRWGGPLPERQVVWSSSDARVAVVTAGGKVNPLRPGSVVLTASCEGADESVRIDIAGTPAAPTAAALAQSSASPSSPASHRRLRKHRRSPVLVMVFGAVVAGGGLGFLAHDGRPGLWPSREEQTGSADFAGGSLEPVPASVAMTPRAARPRPDSSNRPAVEVRQERTRARAPAPKRAPAVVASISISSLDPLPVGDTATLFAVVLDRNGDTLVGRPLVWHSGDTAVATIDPRTGRVRARSSGTTLIVARSGRESGMSGLTVVEPPVANVSVEGARPLATDESVEPQAGAEDPQGAPVPGRPVGWDSRDSTVATMDETTPSRVGGGPPAEALIVAGVEQCYDALRAKNVARVTELYRAVSELDQDNLKKLSRILRTQEWSADIGERVFGQRRIRGDAAVMEFSFRLTWRDAFGGRLSSRPVFRAEFTRQGAEWRMSSCRIVGSPQL